ncbi:3581_t:CDS:2, partial [Gigaspora margarita]
YGVSNLNLETSKNLYVQDNRTHKGQHLTQISGLLPHINERIKFSINDTFPSWPIAEHYIIEYGYQKGFVPIKVHNKINNNGCLMNLYYKCEFGSIYQPKKNVVLQNQRNKGTKKVNCNWQLNLSSATSFVRITSLHDHHALMPDETIESFQWVVQNLEKATRIPPR